ncbi:MAG TPA: hypothetical protein VG028_11185 [Terriglobia bacterium]|nr:hypothetical protein [Terriglobia bacterium]
MKSFGCLLGMVILAAQSTPAQKTRNRAAGVINQDYVLALTAADQFMAAWATRNQDDGLALLSPRLKNKFPEDYFRYYLSGLSNPHHQAFEIGRGKRLPSGEFSFPVTMYMHYTGQKENIGHPKPLTIVVIQAGPESWLVDELPGFVEPETKNP